MKIEYFKCDICEKKYDSGLTVKIGDTLMDLCPVCGYKFASEAAGLVAKIKEEAGE